MRVGLDRYSDFEVVGAGGMGSVFRATHEAGQTVAIKVVTANAGEQAIAGFHREVQAVAALNHPNIVDIFDYGILDNRGAGNLGGVVGSPFMVMELADGTVDLDSVGDWESFRRLIRSVLDALAHSHARGVVHRDLKPENILVFGRGADTIPKLADFGIAHHFRETVPGETLDNVGTPLFAAPEQFGNWRDIGPWTDLYAFGCTAYTLACRRHVFVRENTLQVAFAHLHEPPPAVEAMVAVPAGFEAWIHTLLAKSPAERFRRAADALYAFDALGPPTVAPAVVSDDLLETARTVSDGLEPTEELVIPSPYALSSSGTRAPVAPLPRTWRRTLAHSSATLSGAGLNLFGLRAVPFVGRNTERDQFWASLADVAQSGEAGIILMRGPSGAGKSRLAQWMIERAHEAGHATVLKAVFSSAGFEAEALLGMIRNNLPSRGLGTREVAERIRTVFDFAEPFPGVDELATELAVEPNDRSAEMAFFPSAQKRLETCAGYAKALSRERTAVVWLDDVQWAPDALDLLEVVARDPGWPGLIVATYRTDEPTAFEGFRERINALGRHPLASTIDVAPLNEDEHVEFVDALLALAPDLRDRIASRTSGNPLFAWQLVGEWVRRGDLVPGDDGRFVLRAGSLESAPDSIHELLSGRVRNAVSGLGPDAQLAVEIAGALGPGIDLNEWRVACNAAQLNITDQMIDQLILNGLATRVHESAVELVHGMLTETLAREAANAGHTRQVHDACRAMVESTLRPSRPAYWQRVAHHAIAAGHLEIAADALFNGAARAADMVDSKNGLAMLERRRALVDQLGGKWDEQRVRACLLEATGRAVLGESELAHEILREAETAARADFPDLLPEVLRNRGVTARLMGDYDTSLLFLEEAAQTFEARGELGGAARAYMGTLLGLRFRGRMQDALTNAERAVSLFERAGDQPWSHLARRELYRVYLHAGRFDIAIKGLTELWNEVDREDPLGVLSGIPGDLGNVARIRGRLDEADEWFKVGHDRQVERGDMNQVLGRSYFVWTAVQREQWESVRAILAEIRPSIVGTAMEPICRELGFADAMLAYLDGGPSAATAVLSKSIAAITEQQAANRLILSAAELAVGFFEKRGEAELENICRNFVEKQLMHLQLTVHDAD